LWELIKFRRMLFQTKKKKILQKFKKKKKIAEKFTTCTIWIYTLQ